MPFLVLAGVRATYRIRISSSCFFQVRGRPRAGTMPHLQGRGRRKPVPGRPGLPLGRRPCRFRGRCHAEDGDGGRHQRVGRAQRRAGEREPVSREAPCPQSAASFHKPRPGGFGSAGGPEPSLPLLFRTQFTDRSISRGAEVLGWPAVKSASGLLQEKKQHAFRSPLHPSQRQSSPKTLLSSSPSAVPTTVLLYLSDELMNYCQLFLHFFPFEGEREPSGAPEAHVPAAVRVDQLEDQRGV